MVEGCDTIIIVADSPSVKQIQSKTAFISHIHCGLTRIDQMCYSLWRDTQCIALYSVGYTFVVSPGYTGRRHMVANTKSH